MTDRNPKPEETSKESKISGLRRALSLLALPLCFMYLEWRLASDCGLGAGYHLQTALLAGAACGMIANLIAFAFRRKGAGFAAALILAEIGTFYFCLQFFVNNSYQTFMDPVTIFQGAGGVMEEFGEDLARLVKEGAGYIGLYHIPVLGLIALYPLWDFSRKSKWTPFYVALAAIALQSVTVCNTQMDSFAAPKYTYEYVFNDGIRNFGLITSTQRDVVYSLTEVPDRPKKSGGLVSRGSSSNGAPAFHGLNKLDIDFNALAAAESSSAISAVHSYIAEQKATVKNEYTGMFAGKNLIVICCETLSAEAVSEELTPTLYRLAHNGIQFEDYYHPFWGGSTTSGEFAVLTGIIPVNNANSMQQIIGHKNSSCIGYYLMPQGYLSLAYHNGDYDYYNRYKTHPWLGFERFISNGTGMEGYLTDMWPPSDSEMMLGSVDDWIGTEPFYIYYMTYSGHSIYNFTHHEQAIKHKDEVKDLNASTKIKAYIASQLELEEAVSILMDRLTEADLLDDTVIVVTADHYPYPLQNSMIWANDRDYVAELYGYPATNEMLRDHEILMIWNGELEKREDSIVVSQPCSAIDIIPTVLNLMGVDYDSRLYPGRDLLSTDEGLVIWNSYSWKTEKGFYDATTGHFTPEEGQEADADYIDSIKEIVRGKINYCRNVIEKDYFSYVFPE